MARIIASFLAFAWASSASVLRANDRGAKELSITLPADLSSPSISTVRQSVSGISTPATAGDASRVSTCQYCHKICPISCFVGTCGIHYAYSVRKFEGTNQCYSCDPSVSVGVSKDGDFLRCEAGESGAPEPSSEGDAYDQVQSVQQGPQGPAVPGDAGLAALKASRQAQMAVYAATAASIQADKAAKAATAQYRSITGQTSTEEGGQYFFSDQQQATYHEQATRVRAEESLRLSEAAHLAWKVARDEYNKQIELLRRQQILTDQAEQTLEQAESRSEQARGQYASMQAELQRAQEASMSIGGSSANKITSQAAAEELAGAAQAAHRRLVIAAKEAKEASKKIDIAAAMAPCTGGTVPATHAFLQGDSNPQGVIGCMSIKELEEQEWKQSQLAAEAAAAAKAKLPHKAPPPRERQPHNPMDDLPPVDIAGLGDTAEEPAAPMQGTLEVPSVEQQMTANLAEQIERNPAAVQDSSMFAVPSVPFTADQVPMDGTQQPPSIDLGSMSALQKGSQRRSLRLMHA